MGNGNNLLTSIFTFIYFSAPDKQIFNLILSGRKCTHFYLQYSQAFGAIVTLPGNNYLCSILKNKQSINDD